LCILIGKKQRITGDSSLFLHSQAYIYIASYLMTCMNEHFYIDRWPDAQTKPGDSLNF